MKKILGAVLAVTAVAALAGCTPEEPEDRLSVDERYVICVEAGGTFEYNGSLPYWACYLPGAEKK